MPSKGVEKDQQIKSCDVNSFFHYRQFITFCSHPSLCSVIIHQDWAPEDDVLVHLVALDGSGVSVVWVCKAGGGGLGPYSSWVTMAFTCQQSSWCFCESVLQNSQMNRQCTLRWTWENSLALGA
jgi:hypothetical protein